jgi:hypothetical protein
MFVLAHPPTVRHASWGGFASRQTIQEGTLTTQQGAAKVAKYQCHGKPWDTFVPPSLKTGGRLGCPFMTFWSHSLVRSLLPLARPAFTQAHCVTRVVRKLSMCLCRYLPACIVASFFTQSVAPVVLVARIVLLRRWVTRQSEDKLPCVCLGCSAWLVWLVFFQFLVASVVGRSYLCCGSATGLKGQWL